MSNESVSVFYNLLVNLSKLKQIGNLLQTNKQLVGGITDWVIRTHQKSYR